MSIDTVSAEPSGPLGEKVLQFVTTMARLVSEADPPVTASYWAPLEAFVAVGDFERLVPEDAFSNVEAGDAAGPDGESWSTRAIGWHAYVELFNGWVQSSPRYENSVRRIAEFPGLVYVEIEEHHTYGEMTSIFNSLSTYEFDDDGRICRIRVAPAADHLTVPTQP
ncbi:MAG TPA: hypothetical protein VH986_05990 [Acidimicrobiia bacterium]